MESEKDDGNHLNHSLLRISKRVRDQGLEHVTEDPVDTWCKAHEKEGESILDLICTNPTEVGFDYRGYTEVFSAAANLPEMLRYHPDPAGLAVVRTSIADHFFQTYGESFAPDDILLTASTSESYSVLFDMLTDPGDAILLPQPGYPLVEVIAGNKGVRMDSYRLQQKKDGKWVMDLKSLEAAVHERTRVIICISPHNPTGSVLSYEEIEFLERLCSRRGIALIIDEVFRDYALVSCEQLNQVYHLNCSTFVLNGMSKLAALPQLKLAWIALVGSSESRSLARPVLEYLLDAQLSVSNFAQWVVPGLLKQVSLLQTQIRQRCDFNYQQLQAFAELLELKLDPYCGGWYGVIREDPRWSGADVSILFARHCALKIHPGYFYGLPDAQAVVFSLLVDPQDLEVGLSRIGTFLK